jgi:hypothetical protein
MLEEITTITVDEKTTSDSENTPEHATSEETTTAQEPKTKSTALPQKQDITTSNCDIFFK